jgi:hypothetical protein
MATPIVPTSDEAVRRRHLIPRSRRLVFLAMPAVFALLAAGVGPAAIQAATGRTLYVATSGVDYGADGHSVPTNTITTPWRTIEKTVTRARPGDTIVVRGGTYQEIVGWGAVKATATQPIVLKAYSGERVVVKGILGFKGADYWTIDRINVVRDPALGRHEYLVNFQGGVGWKFLDSEVSGTNGVSNVMITSSATDGIASNWVIAGNCIHDNLATGDAAMTDHNIYVYPGLSSGPGLIERNILFDAHNGANIKLAGPNSTTGAAYVTVRDNTMVHAAAGVVIGYGTHHTRLVNNLVGLQWGGTSSYIAAYIANHLTGSPNNSTGLAVWGYKKSINSVNATTRPISATGSIWVHPVFDNVTSCAGFHNSDPVSSAYGISAP